MLLVVAFPRYLRWAHMPFCRFCRALARLFSERSIILFVHRSSTISEERIMNLKRHHLIIHLHSLRWPI